MCLLVIYKSLVFFFFFFFSSRRRHTRFDCDWSSDVCSSDLLKHLLAVDAVAAERARRTFEQPALLVEPERLDPDAAPLRHLAYLQHPTPLVLAHQPRPTFQLSHRLRPPARLMSTL